MVDERRRPGRKLLVASLGVASVSYLGCGTSAVPSNPDGASDVAAKEDAGDAGQTSDTSPISPGDDGGASDAKLDRHIIANLALP